MKVLWFLSLLALILEPALCLPNPASKCECGVENLVNNRIIRGRKSPAGQYPWMVYLRMYFSGNQASSCTGSIINDQYIMTAAHCVQRRPIAIHAWFASECDKDRLKVRDALNIRSYIHHHNFEETGSFHDIALLKLEEKLVFNSTFSPICLPDFQTYDNFVASGWGLVNAYSWDRGHHKVETQCLMEADLDIWKPRECDRHHPGLDHRKVICAGGNLKGTVCQGDSGGPLMTRKDGYIYQAGITSYGRKDCGILTPSPAIFERTAAHYDWIRKQTRGANWCSAPRHVNMG